MAKTENPLTAPVPAEVLLPRAPLIRVISRINFPAIVSISKSEFIAPFQEAIREQYPVLRPDKTLSFHIPNLPSSIAPTPQTTWRFSDTDDSWRVSLANTFVALETKTAYVSKGDLIERLTKVVDALVEHINPRTRDRVGLRYVDRITGGQLKNLKDLVRPEIVGLLGCPAAKSIQHSLTETVFVMPGGKRRLQVRWGRMPAEATVDPAAIEPINEESWILDLDMVNSASGELSTAAVVDEIGEFSDRIYTFFRWAVTDKFLRLFGGDV